MEITDHFIFYLILQNAENQWYHTYKHSSYTWTPQNLKSLWLDKNLDKNQLKTRQKIQE